MEDYVRRRAKETFQFLSKTERNSIAKANKPFFLEVDAIKNMVHMAGGDHNVYLDSTDWNLINNFEHLWDPSESLTVECILRLKNLFADSWSWGDKIRDEREKDFFDSIRSQLRDEPTEAALRRLLEANCYCYSSKSTDIRMSFTDRFRREYERMKEYKKDIEGSTLVSSHDEVTVEKLTSSELSFVLKSYGSLPGLTSLNLYERKLCNYMSVLHKWNGIKESGNLRAAIIQHDDGRFSDLAFYDIKHGKYWYLDWFSLLTLIHDSAIIRILRKMKNNVSYLVERSNEKYFNDLFNNSFTDDPHFQKQGDNFVIVKLSHLKMETRSAFWSVSIPNEIQSLKTISLLQRINAASCFTLNKYTGDPLVVIEKY